MEAQKQEIDWRKLNREERGKLIFENGKIRQKAILDCKHGIITLEELHKIARKHKYLLSTKVVEGVNYKKYELVKED